MEEDEREAEAKRNHFKLLENLNQATKAEREAKRQQHQAKAPPLSLQRPEQTFTLPLPNKQERFIREIEEANKIRKPNEEQRTTAVQSSGGDNTKAKNEDLIKELKDLEDQYERKKNLASGKINDLGQRLLSCEEGFTWCPECH